MLNELFKNNKNIFPILSQEGNQMVNISGGKTYFWELVVPDFHQFDFDEISKIQYQIHYELNVLLDDQKISSNH